MPGITDPYLRQQLEKRRDPGGPPTPDKPGITVADYQPGDTTSIFLNLRVADIQACYEEWTAKGAEFVTPPIDRGAEIRCYMRDPDGYLIEVGQSTGLLRGPAGQKAPGGSPGLNLQERPGTPGKARQRKLSRCPASRRTADGGRSWRSRWQTWRARSAR